MSPAGGSTQGQDFREREHADEAQSRPPASHKTASATHQGEGIAENFMTEVPKTSVSSVSAQAPGGSSSEGASKPLHDRPTDEQIIEHENQLRAEQSAALVGEKEPIEGLLSEYEFGSQVYVAKIHDLNRHYAAIRRTRGDGNCFFRSFLFAYLETMVEGQNPQAREKFADLVKASKPRLLQAGFQELVFEDSMDFLLDLLARLGAPVGPLTLPQLEERIRSPEQSNTIVMFLRFLVSAEIQLREDFFAPFVLGMSDDCLSVEQFCRRSVEPMGEESDHVHIVALCDALQVPIRVVYLDQSLAPGGGGGDAAAVNWHDFTPNTWTQGQQHPAQPEVHVLYRPGHYDVLYLKA